jgi:DNA processing protein
LGAARWVGADDADFPRALCSIADAPDGLWMRSTIPDRELGERLWSHPTVAIVGARAASGAGLEIARQLAWGLARTGVLIVSGRARGIDAAAHEGALLGATTAVLGAGLDACYPPENAPLAERITQSGALLSEWPCNTPARPWHFPHRNRLVSGLSDVIVVVEGGARSGAWHTVRFALAQGREVMAVPRDPLLAGSELPNRLLRDGAAPAIAIEDVLRALPADRGALPPAGVVAPEQARPAPSEAPRTKREPAAHGPVEKQLLARLSGTGGLTLEQLAEALPALPVAELQARLVALEVEGHLRRGGSLYHAHRG